MLTSDAVRVDMGTAEDLFTKRDVLKTTLSSLQDIMIEEGEASKDLLALQFEEHKFLVENFEEAKEMATQKQEEVDKLAVSEPVERLETTGTLSKQEAQGKYSRFTPNFIFDLSTTYPIRKVNAVIENKSSKWKRQTWMYGGTTFQAELGNSPFSSASATVELYGWPKEIHHEELIGKQKELLERRTRQESLQQQVTSAYSALETLRSKDQAYGEAIGQCAKDMQKVQSLAALRNIDPQRMTPYIEANSIHGLAILLNLNSMLSKDSPLVGDVSTALAQPLLCGQRDMLISMKKYVKNISATVNEIAQTQATKEDEFQQAASTLLTDRLEADPFQAEFHRAQCDITESPFDVNDDEQNSLNQKSRHAVAKL